MSADPTVEELADPARKSRVWRRTIRRLALVAIVCIIVAAVAGVGWWQEKQNSDNKSRSIHASQDALAASQQSLKVANCVNAILNLRQIPASADSNAYDELWKLLGNVLTAAPGGETTAAYNAFLTALAKDNVLLANNQTFRAEHPLGQC